MADDSPCPRIGIVVVNFHAPELTLACLERLDAMDEWPRDRLRLVLVDNGSDPGFADEVSARVPAVEYLDAGGNLGFGGACNVGFRALTDCDYVALLNNDATPEPGWLAPLVAAFDDDDDSARVGAATPKVLLDGAFVEVTIDAPTTRPGGPDPRSLGVQLCGARVGGTDVSTGIELVRGFWGWEVDETTVGGRFAWTGHDEAEAVCLLAVPNDVDTTATVELRLASALRPVKAKVTVGDGPTMTVAADQRPAWVDAGPVGRTRDVVNNTGTVLLPDGASADRGYLEVDAGRYDEPEDVFGWSGAAVLLSRRYLDDVGPFDERLFLYYEDTDLSWRGRRLGWTYRYVPASVVRHAHSSTTGANRPLVRHLSERNRLLVLAKNGPARLAVDAVRRVGAEVARALARDVLARLLRGRRPVGHHAHSRARVLAGYARLLPGALIARRRLTAAVRERGPR